MNHSSTNLVYMALGAVLIALCSWITVPAAVPFTMQTFAVFFILSALGGKQGTVTILVYIALGAVGVPVFSQFGAGPGVLLGNTGGYILGFLASALAFSSARWALIMALPSLKVCVSGSLPGQP